MNRLNDLLLHRFGWSLETHRNLICPLAQQRRRELGLSTEELYLQRVETDRVEMQVLAEELGVRETWFKREIQPLRRLLESLRARPRFMGSEPFRILSLPCSSGEEPYTLLMLAQEMGMDTNSLLIEGVDLSYRAIAQAKHGHYRNNSFRGSDLVFRDRFFTPRGCEWQIDPSFPKQVRFSVGNLLDIRCSTPRGVYDAVICRNLLIYFAATARQQSMENLKSLLKPDGTLVVSACEAPLPTSFGFESTDTIGVFTRERAQSIKPQTHRLCNPLARPTVLARKPDAKALTGSTLPPGHTMKRARRLADEGRLEASVQECLKLLQLEGPSAECYLLLGVSYGALENLPESEACLRKAVYLQPEDGEALTHLSLTLARQGKTTEAALLRDRATRTRKDWNR